MQHRNLIIGLKDISIKYVLGLLILIPNLVETGIQKFEYIAVRWMFIVPTSVQTHGYINSIAIEGLNVQPAFTFNIVFREKFGDSKIVPVFVFIKPQSDLLFLAFIQIINNRLQYRQCLLHDLIVI